MKTIISIKIKINGEALVTFVVYREVILNKNNLQLIVMSNVAKRYVIRLICVWRSPSL